MPSTAAAWKDPLARLPLTTPHPSQPATEEPPSLPSPSPSPSNPPSWRDRDLFGRVTWALETYRPRTRGDDTTGVLCAFLEHLSGEGRSALMSDIVQFASPDPGHLRALRDFLVNAVLKPMTLAGMASTPRVVVDPQAQESMADTDEPVDSDALRSAAVALRDGCLARDGNRCAVTSVIGSDKSPAVGPDHHEGLYGVTHCAHILPFALSSETPLLKTDDKATIWWALYRYFPFLRGKVTSGSINKPHNAVSLGWLAYPQWGLYNVALEPICPEENTYRCHCFVKRLMLGSQLPDTVTLEQHAEILLPDPDFFRFHFQLAKILDQTGIRRKISWACSENQAQAVSQNSITPNGSTDIGRILRRRMLLDI